MRTQPSLLSALLLPLLLLAAPVRAQPRAAEGSATTTESPQPATDRPVAEVPPPSEAPGPTPMDLAAEGSDDGDDRDDGGDAELDALAAGFLVEANAEEPSLRLYGFADFNMQRVLIDRDSSWATFLPRAGSFLIGNLNLYLDAQLSTDWRSMAEIRFTYVPHGTAYTDNSGTILYRDKTTFDPIGDSDTIQWGSIVLERAWIEYAPHELVAIRGGSWLTPYGIWNVDHGSPVLIGTQAPWVVGEELLPERQTGIQIYGGRYFGAVKLGYHLTLSNGRGPIDAWQDLDKYWGYGGRVYLETDAVGALTLGVSGYGGRYTDAVRTVTPVFDESGEFVRIGNTRDVREQYDEIALAFDLRWEWQDLLVALEVAHNQRAYTEKGRPPPGSITFGGTGAPAAPGTYAPDDRRYGGYVLLAYRLPFWNLRPFGIFEYYSATAYEQANPDSWLVHAGLNVEILPNLVAKAEYRLARWLDPPRDGFHDFDLGAVNLQVAWAF